MDRTYAQHLNDMDAGAQERLVREGFAADLPLETGTGTAPHDAGGPDTARSWRRIGETEVEILQGKAHIRKSPCSHKICIKSGYIQYADRITACLPNRVVVRILGDSYRGIDAVVS
mgnify:CR=1 FL=1